MSNENMIAEVVCVVCPNGCRLRVDPVNETVEGNRCPRGHAYGLDEVRDPKRILTTTVRVSKNGETLHDTVLPVRSKVSIPKRLLFDAMRAVNAVTVPLPVESGHVVVKDICGTGVDVVASRRMQ